MLCSHQTQFAHHGLGVAAHPMFKYLDFFKQDMLHQQIRDSVLAWFMTRSVDGVQKQHGGKSDESPSDLI